MTSYRLGSLNPRAPDDQSAWVAPSAAVIGDVQMGRNVGIWFGAVIRADNTPIVIGAGSNIQDGAILHSDPGSPLTIGEQVTVGHGAILHGCTIGSRVLIGMGAIILNGAIIEDDCIVGAGALVTERKTFPNRSLIVGSPAASRRALSAEDLLNLIASAESYIAKAASYKAALRSEL